MKLLFAAAFFSALLPSAIAQDHPITLRVLPKRGDKILAQPILPAVFGFRLEAGAAPVEGILRCTQHTDYRTLSTVRYPVLELRCEGGTVLILTDVDLGGR